MRQEKQSKAIRDISWKAQQRLHQRYKVLSTHRKKTGVADSALARELTGFVWAIACQLGAPHQLKERKPIRSAAKSGRDYQLNPQKKFKK